MKSANDKVPYFAAYPLKALNLPEEEYESHLRIERTAPGQPQSRIRILPMANPYKERDFLETIKEQQNNSHSR